ncbi:NAD(P)/FAD-dependent oxidoreductase [Paenibacillus sp. Marseille-P2973]|uniref:NAD(P)/FAD-dependent oxidoreductase n=1 Tax=Paenibacillus sp. Marseille-P2973 TaxID=1871032 RepID=UPI001B37ACDE|nr:NAD(P)/FAD-dependent oxidoreductase [Paenibacillus sp. Marseille-P2973]MBQ4898035.1 NAD(P)/FAD-dependent oxidoreductase [Paenibacillus sp. Marseille-P2973]
MEHSVDVVVLGGGISGSCIAKALADKQWDTALIDRRNFPRHKVCGEFLSPEAQSTLNALGLTDSLESLNPTRIERAQLIFEQGREIELPVPGAAWGLSRYRMDEALHSAAMQAGAQLHLSTTVTGVEQHGEGYIVRTKRGTDTNLFHARAVIAAWGTNSRVANPGHRPDAAASRQQAYIGVKTHYAGLRMGPVIEMYFFQGGYLGLCPVDDGRVNAAALLNRSEFGKTGKSVMSILEAAIQRNRRLAERLATAVPVPDSQAAIAPVYLQYKPSPWNGLPRIGDAAATIAPLCGDGMSMALRSAALCAPLADSYLRGCISLLEWEQRYTQVIQQEFASPLRWGSLLQWLVSKPVVHQLVPSAARLAPLLENSLFRATRLKPMEPLE